MPSEQLARNGAYFLKRDRNAEGTISICTCKKVTSANGNTSNQTVKVAATHTSDPLAARIALDRFVLTDLEAQQRERERAQRPDGSAPPPQDLHILDVLNFYYLKKMERKASCRNSVRSAMSAALRAWPRNPRCSELTETLQEEFVAYGRSQGWSDHTILQRLRYCWSAMRMMNTKGKLGPFPQLISSDAWEAHLAPQKSAYKMEQLGALYRAAFVARVAQPHLWRYLILALATGSRPTALLELRWSQIDVEDRLIYLNPPERRQTKKRRPVIPMCLSVFHEISGWERRGDYVIERGDEALKSMAFHKRLCEQSGVGGTAMILRHTVRTFLARRGVKSAQADTFIGHRDATASPTARWYVHLEPGYLKDASEAIEALIEEVRMHAFGCQDQPSPDDTFCARLRYRMGQLRGDRVADVFANVLN